MKNKIPATLCSALLILSLAGCGEASISPPETTVTTAEETAPETTVINHVKVPVEDYTGLWYDGKNAANNVIIAGYPQKGIHFCARFDNSLSISGIGVYTDGKYIFGYDDGSINQLDGTTGEIVFEDDGISFVCHFPNEDDNKTINAHFTVKDESDIIDWPPSDMPENGTTGEIVFEDDGISFVCHFPNEDDNKTINAHFTVKDESDIIDWPPSDMPENIESDLQAIIDELSRKGWKDIEVYPHEPNTSNRFGGLCYEPIELPEGGILYCVSAHYPWEYNSVYAIIYSVYVDGTRIDELSETYYISSRGGSLRGRDVYNFVFEHEETMYGIVDADNELLYEFLAKMEFGPQV